ncbi:MAG: AAA family ATPase [Muribaculaceae bacterium]|nr:AAA family ATPase [Muribaculaceae bacterium]
MKKITATDLRIQPFTPSSPVSQDNPGYDHFTTRRDFILFKRISGVALAVVLDNPGAADSPASGNFSNFEAAIYLEDRKIAAREFSARLNSATRMRPMRIDISLHAEDIEPGNFYHVKISRIEPDGDPELQCCASMRFINVNVLPTRYYTPEACQAYYTTDGNTNSLYIRVTTTDALDGLDLPAEVTARVVWPDGTETTVSCDASRLDNKTVSLLTELNDIEDPAGTTYVEFLAMGYPFTGLLLRPASHKDNNEINLSRLGVIKDYKAGSVEAPADNRALEPSAYDRLARMVGLEDVKERVAIYTAMARMNRLRRRAGMQTPAMPLHALFLGSPGTGKTSVARILGEILHEAGVLSSGHVVVRERSSLIGRYYGTEEENTRKALEEASGGILFIDEAYQLHRPDDLRDPGRLVLESLMTALADENRRDWMLILAGYTAPMLEMLATNPGLASRLPECNHYRFADFNPRELMQIAENFLDDYDFQLSPGARYKLVELLESDWYFRDSAFGNGRHVNNIITAQVLPAMARRLATIGYPSQQQLATIIADDIPAPAIAMCDLQQQPGLTA